MILTLQTVLSLLYLKNVFKTLPILLGNNLNLTLLSVFLILNIFLLAKYLLLYAEYLLLYVCLSV